LQLASNKLFVGLHGENIIHIFAFWSVETGLDFAINQSDAFNLIDPIANQMCMNPIKAR
jgi:hypothetical protein